MFVIEGEKDIVSSLPEIVRLVDIAHIPMNSPFVVVGTVLNEPILVVERIKEKKKRFLGGCAAAYEASK
jgi:hypothetical protein